MAKANPGVIHVPANGSIQAAINASSPGDTIVVAAGIFNGTVTIMKGITLVGQGAGKTVIDAQSLGPAVNITQTSNVAVTGFTIRNNDIFTDGIVVNASSNLSIVNNTIMASVDSNGIMVSSSENVTVADNLIQASSQSNGTFVVSSNTVTVFGNNVTGNVYGISIAAGFGNLVAENNATGNSVGIGVYGSQGNKIADNRASKNQAKGIELNSGSTGNIVARNIIANNTFGLWIQSSSQNLVVQNNVDFNNRQSSSYGVYLSGATGNRIFYNNIRNNTIQMFGVNSLDMSGNIWNDSQTNPRGNFWSDYSGVDNDGDGVGDTKVPWPCPSGGSPCSSFATPGVDYYPTMTPWKLPPISVIAKAAPLSGCPGTQGLQVNLSATASGGLAPYSFSWVFGDGGSGSVQNLSHYYTKGGTYFPKVTVVDNTLTANGTDLTAVTVFSGNLSLHVTDQASKPLSGARIDSVSQPPGQSSFSLVADGQGSAKVACLTPGNYRVQVSDSGFKSTIVGFTVANMTVTVPVSLVSVPGTFPYLLVLYAGLGGAVAAGLAIFYVYRSRKHRLSA